MYHCPHCGTLVELERDACLADKSVAPYPLEGREYVTPEDAYESADGVRFVRGEDESPHRSFVASERDTTEDVGCGEPFYLRFVRFEAGEQVEPEPPTERVEIGTGIGPDRPRGPDWSR